MKTLLKTRLAKVNQVASDMGRMLENHRVGSPTHSIIFNIYKKAKRIGDKIVGKLNALDINWAR